MSSSEPLSACSRPPCVVNLRFRFVPEAEAGSGGSACVGSDGPSWRGGGYIIMGWGYCGYGG